jgi:hypothetical protein
VAIDLQVDELRLDADGPHGQPEGRDERAPLERRAPVGDRLTRRGGARLLLTLERGAKAIDHVEPPG